MNKRISIVIVLLICSNCNNIVWHIFDDSFVREILVWLSVVVNSTLFILLFIVFPLLEKRKIYPIPWQLWFSFIPCLYLLFTAIYDKSFHHNNFVAYLCFDCISLLSMTCCLILHVYVFPIVSFASLDLPGPYKCIGSTSFYIPPDVASHTVEVGDKPPKGMMIRVVYPADESIVKTNSISLAPFCDEAGYLTFGSLLQDSLCSVNIDNNGPMEQEDIKFCGCFKPPKIPFCLFSHLKLLPSRSFINAPIAQTPLEVPLPLSSTSPQSRSSSPPPPAAACQNRKYPLLIYCHGDGGTRLDNQTLHEDLASLGYIVVALDFTDYSSSFTVMPQFREEKNHSTSDQHSQMDISTHSIDKTQNNISKTKSWGLEKKSNNLKDNIREYTRYFPCKDRMEIRMKDIDCLLMWLQQQQLSYFKKASHPPIHPHSHSSQPSSSSYATTKINTTSLPEFSPLEPWNPLSQSYRRRACSDRSSTFSGYAALPSEFGNLFGSIDLSRVAIIGHSFGGSVVLCSCQRKRLNHKKSNGSESQVFVSNLLNLNPSINIRASVALDGWLMMYSGTLLQMRNVFRPVLFMNAEKWQIEGNINRMLMVSGGTQAEKTMKWKRFQSDRSHSNLVQDKNNEEEKEKKDMNLNDRIQEKKNEKEKDDHMKKVEETTINEDEDKPPKLNAQIITHLGFKHENMTDIPLLVPYFSRFNGGVGTVTYRKGRESYRKVLYMFLDRFVAHAKEEEDEKWDYEFSLSLERLSDHGFIIGEKSIPPPKEFDF